MKNTKIVSNKILIKRAERQYASEIVNLEKMTPKDHYLRVIEKYFD